MTLAALLGQIPLSPPLNVRLIALVVVEVVLLALVVVLWLKYEQLKTVSVDEWWERRKQAGVSRRVERMMRESHEAWLAEQGQTTESGLTGGAPAPDEPGRLDDRP